MLKFVIFSFVSLLQIFLISCGTSLSDKVFIRSNQVGFYPADIKTAIILSREKLDGCNFSVVDVNSDKIVYQDNNFDSLLSYGKFNFCYRIDFSKVRTYGKYKIRIQDIESLDFEIGNKIYNPVRDSLAQFFRCQRCGDTNPFLHEPCHLFDATQLIGYRDTSAKDLSGGWHDAGDYIKFLKTTAYTSYLLLFSYDFDKQKFGFDLNDNSDPDILEEAKIGIDWLLKCNMNNEKLVVQVQDERDHNVSWRLPENDSLEFSRPAYVNIAKNTIGYYVSALALASQIWKSQYHDERYASKCLEYAEKFYSLRNQAEDIDSTFPDFYPDKDFNGKLALAAIELYNATKKSFYLTDAVEYSKKAGSDFWWSVAQINSLAHYRIAKYYPESAQYIYNNLKHCVDHSRKSVFNESFEYSWGTTNTFLGISLQAILYKNLTGSTDFDSLNFFQRDYILGRNPWGYSFIYNIGENSVKNLHSQIGFFNKGYLPGALSEGPAPKSLLDNFHFTRLQNKTGEFNSEQAEFYDDIDDFVCNEPTISSNATALFVFGFFSNQ